MSCPESDPRSELREFAETLGHRFPGWFSANHPVWVSRAPGRLDVMGGIADYSGSLVLELPLDRATFVAVQPRSDGLARVWSANAAADGDRPRMELALDVLGGTSAPISYDLFRQRVGNRPESRWVRYVLGPALVLLREGRVKGPVQGFNLAVWSTVPAGAGVASSAALEVATLAALSHAWFAHLEPNELALLAQKVENQAVGVPCGVMDQMTSALGRRGHLLALLCQPAQVEGHVRVPDGVLLCGVDTGVKHSVGGERYRDTRVATFMGRKIIFSSAGAGSDPAGGYLCNISPREYVKRFRAVLPARLAGRDFLERFASHDDPATEVDPERTYLVRSRTEHAIYENARVRKFRTWLREFARTGSEQALTQAGRLMLASHWSYTKRAGLGATEADFLVRAVRQLGPKAGLYGAKITGGGSGGTVAILGRRGAEEAVRNVAALFEEHFGRNPEIFWGSSPGAAEAGVLRINPKGHR